MTQKGALGLSDKQKQVLSWLGKKWTAYPGAGDSFTVNGMTLCNGPTMRKLQQLGYVEQDSQGLWNATAAGIAITKEHSL